VNTATLFSLSVTHFTTESRIRTELYKQSIPQSQTCIMNFLLREIYFSGIT